MRFSINGSTRASIKMDGFEVIPPQPILLDQSPEFATDDQISADVVQPNALAKRSQPFQRIVFYVLACPLSSPGALDRGRR
jgi:hypothetical protein